MSDLVLVTGITGFIAKHTALKLLKDGFHVRGTLRTKSRSDEVKATLERHGADVSGLSFVEADLTSDSGWEEACEGCLFVQHLASPFPVEQPKDREALVPMAREGALRVLKAAKRSDVKRIVFTSSMVAMMYRPDRAPETPVVESDWTDPEWPPASAYIVSKTRAEKSAWEWAAENDYKERFVTVNPGFVLGPGLDKNIGASLDVIKMLVTGAYPAIPRVSYPVVDVRDLADLLVAAITALEAGGRRLIGASDTLSLSEMAEVLRKALPEKSKKLPKLTLPDFVIKLAANFDPALKSVIADLGVTCRADTKYVTKLTRVEFRPATEAVIAAAESLYSESVL